MGKLVFHFALTKSPLKCSDKLGFRKVLVVYGLI